MKSLFSTKSRVLVNVIGGPLFLYIIFKGQSIFNISIFAISIIAIYELFTMFCKSENKLKDCFYFFIYLLFIALFYSSMLEIRDNQDGLYLIILMLVSIWICDSAAYIFGSRFGKRKIAESISPNKTWFGSISGFFAVSLFAAIFIYINFFSLNLKYDSTSLFVCSSIIFGILSQLGDLLESKIKRLVGVKDSGKILMGHGGILDRFDSIIFSAPFFYYLVIYG